MKNLSALLQPMGRWLISLLIGKWGLPLLLVGMITLAGSTAAYLTSSRQPAQAEVTTISTAAFTTGECASIALPVRPTDIRIKCR